MSLRQYKLPIYFTLSPPAEFSDEGDDDFDEERKQYGGQKPQRAGAANQPKTKTPVLDNFGRDISRLAENG